MNTTHTFSHIHLRKGLLISFIVSFIAFGCGNSVEWEVTFDPSLADTAMSCLHGVDELEVDVTFSFDALPEDVVPGNTIQLKIYEQDNEGTPGQVSNWWDEDDHVGTVSIDGSEALTEFADSSVTIVIQLICGPCNDDQDGNIDGDDQYCHFAVTIFYKGQQKGNRQFVAGAESEGFHYELFGYVEVVNPLGDIQSKGFSDDFEEIECFCDLE